MKVLLAWFIGPIPESDSSATFMLGVPRLAFPSRPVSRGASGMAEASRFSCMQFFSVQGVSDSAGPHTNSRIDLSVHVAFPSCAQGRHPEFPFFEAPYPARWCLCLRFDDHVKATAAKLEVRTVRYSFPVGLFHSRLHAG